MTESLVSRCTLPAFALGSSWEIVAMNAAFRQLMGDELGCQLGDSVQRIIDSLSNRDAIRERANRLFFTVSATRSVDHEPLLFNSTRYGELRIQKLGARIPDRHEGAGHWVVQLNVVDGQKLEDLFEDLAKAIEKENGY